MKNYGQFIDPGRLFMLQDADREKQMMVRRFVCEGGFLEGDPTAYKKFIQALAKCLRDPGATVHEREALHHVTIGIDRSYDSRPNWFGGDHFQVVLSELLSALRQGDKWAWARLLFLAGSAEAFADIAVLVDVKPILPDVSSVLADVA